MRLFANLRVHCMLYTVRCTERRLVLRTADTPLTDALAPIDARRKVA